MSLFRYICPNVHQFIIALSIMSRLWSADAVILSYFADLSSYISASPGSLAERESEREREVEAGEEAGSSLLPPPPPATVQSRVTRHQLTVRQYCSPVM